jgi:ATP-dependent DNA ligase
MRRCAFLTMESLDGYISEGDDVAYAPLRTLGWDVEPELYCRVQSQGWTNHGRLCHAVFRGLLA